MKPVYSSRRVKDIYDLINEAEKASWNPDVDFWIAPDGAEVTLTKYPNKLWKKEIRKGNKIKVRFSCRLHGRVVVVEQHESVLNIDVLEKVSTEVADMFSQYSSSKIFLK